MKSGFMKNLVFPCEKHTFCGSEDPKIMKNSTFEKIIFVTVAPNFFY